MADDGDHGPDDRMQHEAEELMRQRRFRDAARRYQDLHRGSPADLWTALGFASALECAGELEAAERVLEEAARRHGASASLHRFRHLFFTRREDLRRASASQQALRGGAVEAGEADQLADLYFNQGRYHEALAELARRLDDAETDGAERSGLMARAGACLRQTGDAEAARDRLLQALALDPEHAWTLAELAEAERALGMAEQAREHYLAALERTPDDQWTRGHLAQLEHEDGHSDRAIALYDEILKAEPKAAWAKVELAQIIADKDPARSGELCRSALGDDPEYPWAHAHLGLLARKAGHFAEAMQAYQRANRAAPDAVWILHEACEAARAAGRDDLAEQALERARAIDPYDATTHGYIADLRRHQGRMRDAAGHLEQAVQRDPDYTWALRELAEVRALLGEHDAADEAYRRARDLAPDDSVTDGLRAFLYKHRGDRDRGVPWLERAVERQPDYLWAWRELAELHLVGDRPDQAADAARRGLVHCPDAAPLHGLLAEALRRQGRRADAQASVARALELAPQAAQLWALKAELAASADDAPAAVEAAARAAGLDPAPEFAAIHAQALLAAGRDAEAQAALDRALSAKQPPVAAFDLAAALAERRGDLAAAIAHLDRAIAAADEPRRQVRRARLQVQRGDRAAAAAILPLMSRDAGVPWGELAATLALAGHAEPARRAAFRHGATLPPAQAWAHLAEIELHLGDRAAAARAVQAAVEAAPEDPQVRTLAAVSAEGRGELPEALRHIDAALASRPGDPGLLRQSALLRERLGQRDDALAAWRRYAGGAAADDGRSAELAAALFRLGEPDAAAAMTPAALAGPATPERQRLWRDRALSVARRQPGGPAAGLAALDGRDDLLAFPGRILAVQLALAAGDVRAGRTHLDAALPTDPLERRVHGVMTARQLLAEGRAAAALAAARDAARESPGDEDPLIAAADALLVLGRFRDALAEIDGDGSAQPWPPERAAIASAIALAVAGPAAAAARLVRCPDPGAHPLGRLMAAALPGTLPAVATRAVAADAGAMGPGLAGPLVAALAAAGRHDLAAAIRLACADAALRRQDPAGAAVERRAAIPHLRRAAGRGAAASFAWRHRDPVGLVRAILW